MFRLSLAVVTLSSVLATEALGQSEACGYREDITNRLKNKYHEVKVADGLVTTGQLIELYVNEEGNFTVLISEPGGRTCVATAGHSFTYVSPTFKPKQQKL